MRSRLPQSVTTRIRFHSLAWPATTRASAATARAAKEFVVFDRPNPIGGQRTEGPVLDPELASFVGRYPIPVRHGVSVGELALLFNDEIGIGRVAQQAHERDRGDVLTPL